MQNQFLFYAATSINKDLRIMKFIFLKEVNDINHINK